MWPFESRQSNDNPRPAALHPPLCKSSMGAQSFSRREAFEGNEPNICKRKAA